MHKSKYKINRRTKINAGMKRKIVGDSVSQQKKDQPNSTNDQEREREKERERISQEKRKRK